MPITKTVYDPLGNAIVLLHELAQDVTVINSTIYLDASLVITNPAMMLECKNDDKYYLRTFEWDNLIVIVAKKAGESYIADNYLLNPPLEFIQNLIKTCKLIK